jgi:D-tyrosyl-tRNA(Tyr) deacylase
VNGQIIGKIDRGIVALVGITEGDDASDVKRAAAKVAGARLWQDGDRPWQRSLLSPPEDDGGSPYSVLVISQFTLFGHINKGAKPDFHAAAPASVASPLFDDLLAEFRRLLGDDRVATGEFGADMKVALVNDGPVTIIHDTRKKLVGGD